ncbi:MULTISPECIES: hypothetical protein [unclassified Moraxella]|uniref:hypothetical protein n=1 Tax=unclassified Moraxella TaxID=2685852 RepID=UPI003AF7AAAD
MRDDTTTTRPSIDSTPNANANINPNNSIDQNLNHLSQNALSVLLVIIETLLTLLLRFDSELRQTVYPLAQQNTVVAIRSYVPHTTFYATFTVNGILLDSQLQPSQQVDVTINGFTWELAQAIFTHKVAGVEKLQLLGEMEKVAQVKQFLLTVGISKIVQNILQSVSGKKPNSDKSDSEKTAKPKTTVAEYRQRIDEQKSQIAQFGITEAELKAQVSELTSKNKLLKNCLLIAIVLFIVCLVGWIIK